MVMVLGCNCREFNPKSQLVRNKKKKNRENTRQRKTITRTRQYLRSSAICLHPRSCRDFTIIREKYKVRLQIFSLSKNTATPPLKTLITKVGFYIYKTGQKNFPRGVLEPPRDLSMSAPTWAYQPKPILY